MARTNNKDAAVIVNCVQLLVDNGDGATPRELLALWKENCNDDPDWADNFPEDLLDVPVRAKITDKGNWKENASRNRINMAVYALLASRSDDGFQSNW